MNFFSKNETIKLLVILLVGEADHFKLCISAEKNPYHAPLVWMDGLTVGILCKSFENVTWKNPEEILTKPTWVKVTYLWMSSLYKTKSQFITTTYNNTEHLLKAAFLIWSFLGAITSLLIMLCSWELHVKTIKYEVELSCGVWRLRAFYKLWIKMSSGNNKLNRQLNAAPVLNQPTVML